MRVEDEDEAKQAMLTNSAINASALSGNRYVPITGKQDFQPLTSGNASQAQEFLLAMEGMDNLRLSFYGLDNGGLFVKKAHMLETEQEMKNGNTNMVMNDGLRQRQEWASICNSLFLGLPGYKKPMWCEISETVNGMDRNGDMEIGGDEGARQPVREVEEMEEIENE
jgi:hypothetical protein